MSLEQRMKELLAQASVLAEASAAGLSERTSSGKAGTREPTIGGPSTYDLIVRRFSNARGHTAKLEAVYWAERLIADVKRQRRAGMTPAEWRFWIAQEHEGRHYLDVAQSEKISPSYVRKIREEHNRRPLDGLPDDKAA